MKPKPEAMQIPYEVYQDLINHLTLHASTDAWAKSCLENLEHSAIAVHDIQGLSKLAKPITPSDN